jgi:hypothetical protein
MKQQSSRVICAQRCSHCKEFRTFMSHTKAEGHYNGIFLCKICRKKGIDFNTPIKKSKKKTSKNTTCNGSKRVKRLKKPSSLDVMDLLVNKQAKKPTKK